MAAPGFDLRCIWIQNWAHGGLSYVWTWDTALVGEGPGVESVHSRTLPFPLQTGESWRPLHSKLPRVFPGRATTFFREALKTPFKKSPTILFTSKTSYLKLEGVRFPRSSCSWHFEPTSTRICFWKPVCLWLGKKHTHWILRSYFCKHVAEVGCYEI